MNILLCVAILAGVAALAVHYRPRKVEGRALCALPAFQAAVILLGGGLVVLHRERVRAAFQARRRAEAAGRHTAKAPARLKEGCPRKFCA